MQDIITRKINTEGQPGFPKPKVPIRDTKAEKDWEATVILSECFESHYVVNKFQQAVPKKTKDWRQKLAERLREEFGWVEDKSKAKGKEKTAEEKERDREKVRREAAQSRDAVTIERVSGNVDAMEDVQPENRQGSSASQKEIDDRLKFKDQQHKQKGPIKRRRIRSTDPRLKKQSAEELQPQHYASSKKQTARVEEEDDMGLSDDELTRKREKEITEEELEAAWESTMRNAPDVDSDSDDDIKMPEPGDDPAVLVDLLESESESEDEYNEEGELKPKLRNAYDGYETFWKTICLIVSKTDEGAEYLEHQRTVARQVEINLMNMPNLNDGQPKDLWEEFGDFDLVTPEGRVVRDDLKAEEPSDDEDGM
ncbi:hypothetical protein BJ508DRAFT_66731 [Ascobolus immersus RN42]|uniref:Uncharacterized protein n=1 Tax=Ascobolus immersus RN42 TaxID=1160509 RepID=A0A3N4IH28_ASCIM|nr:hypothetical protein BJ508DRAFT_66731 [Ascobolus immersus RN42]